MFTSETMFLDSLLSQMSRSQTPGRRLHAENVARNSIRLARLTGCSMNGMHQVYLGAYLHDIGKELIPNAAIEKVNPLTRAEFNQIRCHPWIGYVYLSKHISSSKILNTILYHHEQLNGNGYPARLKGNKIPLEARICAVADVWDALLSNRCYHKAWGTTRAIEFIWMRAGIQFDPDIVSLFLGMMERYEIANQCESELHATGLRMTPSVQSDADYAFLAAPSAQASLSLQNQAWLIAG